MCIINIYLFIIRFNTVVFVHFCITLYVNIVKVQNIILIIIYLDFIIIVYIILVLDENMYFNYS